MTEERTTKELDAIEDFRSKCLTAIRERADNWRKKEASVRSADSALVKVRIAEDFEISQIIIGL